MSHSCCNSYYEVNLRTIADNMRKIKEYIGNTEIMPVIKANAYGMGTVEVAEFLVDTFDCPILACAHTVEGIQIRKSGITKPEILIIGAVPTHILPHAVEHRLQVPIFTLESAYALNDVAKQQGVIAKVQFKIETGMNRIGVKLGEPLDKLLKACKECAHIEIVGAYTHFVQAQHSKDELTFNQFSLFEQSIEQIESFGITLTYKHCCNTGASEWFKKAVDSSTHIRVGSLFLGYSDIAYASNPMGMTESLSWRAYITDIKELQAGESLGYNQFFKAALPTTVATVSVGFGDGIFSHLAKTNGPVLVNDMRTKFLDACMDQCFVDVTGIDCKVDDEVTLFGYSRGGVLLSTKELSAHLGQSDTAFIVGRTERVGIRYIK